MGLRLAGLDFEVAWCAEIEPGPASLHGDTPNLGDITAVDWSSVERVDMIVGGIPCQPTSAAGKRLGEADPRWLWPAARKAVATLRPARFLLENVRGLVSHNKGALFQSIIDDLLTLGYGVRWLTLGACAVGFAHHRHRVFLLAEASAMRGVMAERLDVPECGARRGGEKRSRPTATACDGNGRGAGDSTYRNRGERLKRTNGLPLDAEMALLPTPRASRDGRTNNRGEPQLNGISLLLPTPSAVPYGSNRGGASPDGPVRHSLDSLAVQPERWGRFAEAIARQESTLGAVAPDPTEPNRNGSPRLRAEFVEWLMDVPAGHVTGRLDRKVALKALGNGVVPLQCAQAWLLLTSQQLPTGAKMANTTEEIRDEAERIFNARKAAFDALAASLANRGPDNGTQVDHFTEALHAGIMAMADSWRAHAIACESSTKRSKGVSFRNGLRAAAELAAGFAGGLLSPDFREKMSPGPVAPVGVPADHPDAQREATWIDAAGIFSSDAEREAHNSRLAELDDAGVGLMGATLQREAAASVALDGETISLPERICTCDPYAREYCAAAKCRGGSDIQASDERMLAQAGVADVARDFIAGATDTYEPTKVEAPNVIIPLFASPASAPERLSWDDFARLVGELPVPDHGSFTMVTAAAECGMRYALDRLSRRGLGGVEPETPAWWNIGGKAFHSCAESMERAVMLSTDRLEWDESALGIIWSDNFAAEIAAAEAESPNVPQALWRAAGKGLEGYDWWRVQGPEMLKRYQAYWLPKRAEGWRILTLADGRPALELKLTLDLAGWPFECIIDQVWVRPDGSLWISDPKSGKTKQTSTFQLGGYAHALASTLANGESYLRVDPTDPHRFTIGGGFYDVRAGSHDLETDDLLTRHPLTELRYRAHAAKQLVTTRAYLPRVASFGMGACPSCPRRAICPAQG